MDLKAIKKRLRELRADPGTEGATAEIQRLRGELTRLRQTRDVADMEAPPKKPMRWAPRRPTDSLAEDATDEQGRIMWGNDDVSGWPPELRRRRMIWRP
ncbi:hypothetical protein ACIPX0_12370 [Streptomyces sp. NPDC090075]|uniref:hypothetical protein n=1 Tax=Streptomyces sp. NPDC090075 TaxID=3365937 RepID=UPI00382D749C